jgi:hypothetical protein
MLAFLHWVLTRKTDEGETEESPLIEREEQLPL